MLIKNVCIDEKNMLCIMKIREKRKREYGQFFDQTDTDQ